MEPEIIAEIIGNETNKTVPTQLQSDIMKMKFCSNKNEQLSSPFSFQIEIIRKKGKDSNS
jgi:hypothetical protein